MHSNPIWILRGLLALAVALPVAAQAQSRQFERISTFLACQNSSCITDDLDDITPEIITATDDGRTLIYTDAAKTAIGLINITNAASPLPGGIIQTTGRPAGVVVKGRYLLATINTSTSFVSPSGYLAIYDLQTCIPNPAACVPLRTIDLGGQPDAIALSPDKRYAAIAIENEHDEDEGALPQLPGGHLKIVDLPNLTPATWTLRTVSLTGLAALSPEDPEPEFISINSQNIAAITLQENNHIVLVNLVNGSIVRHFSAGTVTLTNVDILDDQLITPTATITNSRREPDAVVWLSNSRIMTANEGEFGLGGRGFSIYNTSNGSVVQESGNAVEHLAMRHGHYADDRSDNKGNEPEGLAVASYSGTQYAFLGSERGHFVAVYEIDDGEAEFVQLLPTGLEPEGLLALPARNLFVASAPGTNGAPAMISIYERRSGAASYPNIVSNIVSGRPIGWGALSGMAAHRSDEDLGYAVHKNAYAEAEIYTLRLDRTPVQITAVRKLTRNGAPVRYDLEGIAHRQNNGYWVVSEGGTSCNQTTRAGCNLLIEVAADGTLMREVMLPATVIANQVSTGFEGVAVTGSGSTERVYVAFQRTWRNEPAGFARIGQFNPITEEWRFFHYPLDVAPAGANMNLAEITSLGNNRFAVVERDNLAGPDAQIKRIYSFSIAGLTPVLDGAGPFPVVTKSLTVNLLPLMQARKGWVLDSPSGLAVDRDGNGYLVTDNNGVDEALGETQLFKLGKRFPSQGGGGGGEDDEEEEDD